MTKTKLCAIWGGEIWGVVRWVQTAIETREIDQEIIKFSGKKSPKVLFVPTATKDFSWYCDAFMKYYTSLGCKVDILHLYNCFVDKEKIKNQIFKSDIIYVWWGNTFSMMKMWKRFGVDDMLKLAVKKWILLAGLSAGSICQFLWWVSDSRRESDRTKAMILAKWLWILPFYHAPHFNIGEDRKKWLIHYLGKRWWKYIALDNQAAFFVWWNKFKIVKSNSKAKAYLYYKQRGKIVCRELNNNSWDNISSL